MASDSYDYDPTPNTISVTTLMKPVRQIILANRVPEGADLPDIMDRASNRLGATIHDGIERIWKDDASRTSALLALGVSASVVRRVVVNPTDEYMETHPEAIAVYMEQRQRRQVGKWTVTGKFDFVAESQVQDFKTANVLSYKKQRNADKQVIQGSLYRWLDADKKFRKITKDTMVIMHIFMDWMAAFARADPENYPQQRAMKQILQLKSVEEIDNYVRNKLALIDQYWDAPESEIPECDDENLWRSETRFKYYANGFANAKRASKAFDSRTEAYLFFSTAGKGELKEFPGQVKACHYCAAFEACGQKDRLIACGDLEMGQ
jgi:hypothetical protein